MTDTPTPDTSPEELERLAAALLRALQQETATAASRVIHVLTTQADEIARLRALLERAREGLDDLLTDSEPGERGAPRLSYRESARSLIKNIDAELGGGDAS